MENRFCLVILQIQRNLLVLNVKLKTIFRHSFHIFPGICYSMVQVYLCLVIECCHRCCLPWCNMFFQLFILFEAMVTTKEILQMQKEKINRSKVATVRRMTKTSRPVGLLSHSQCMAGSCREWKPDLLRAFLETCSVLGASVS